MIEYRFALDENTKLVDVFSLERNKAGLVINYEQSKFFSLDEKRELIPHLGKNRIKHFKHKPNETSTMGETYLHWLGKKVFEELFHKCIQEKRPFYIKKERNTVCTRHFEEYGINCNLGKRYFLYDLTKYFDGSKNEKKDENFVPDLLLYKKNTDTYKIYIEIFHSSEISTEKEASGNRIIEIKLESEDDIQSIYDLAKGEIVDNVTYYNFKENKKDVICSSNECERKFIQFYITKNRKPVIETEEECNLRRLISNDVFYQKKELYSKFTQFTNEEIMRYFLSEAALNRAKIKSCYLCKYRQFIPLNRHKEDIFCEKNDSTYPPDVALNCDDFTIDTEYIVGFGRVYNKLEEYKQWVKSTTKDLE